MEEKQKKDLTVGIVVLVVVLLIWWAHNNCHLGKFSKKGCANKEGLCGPWDCPAAGAPPAPAAASESRGLHELGIRPGPGAAQPPTTSCAGMNPDAMDEYKNLKYSNGGAIVTALNYAPDQTYTHAPATVDYDWDAAVAAAAPEKDSFVGRSDIGIDGFAARKLNSDHAAFTSTQNFGKQVQLNHLQPPANQARFSSMREGFDGPTPSGLNWSATGGATIN